MADPGTPADRELRIDALTVKSRPSLNRWLVLAASLALAAIAAWWFTHPSGFARLGSYDVQTPVGQPVFVGVLGPSSDSGRTLKINAATVVLGDAPAGTEAAVLLCRGGAIGTSSDANAFCRELVDAAGETFHFGGGASEQLIVRITAGAPGTVEVKGVDLDFREGLQSGTVEVGPRVQVQILGR